MNPPPVTTSPTAHDAVTVASTDVGADVTLWNAFTPALPVAPVLPVTRSRRRRGRRSRPVTPLVPVAPVGAADAPASPVVAGRARGPLARPWSPPNPRGPRGPRAAAPDDHGRAPAPHLPVPLKRRPCDVGLMQTVMRADALASASAAPLAGNEHCGKREHGRAGAVWATCRDLRRAVTRT